MKLLKLISTAALGAAAIVAVNSLAGSPVFAQYGDGQNFERPREPDEDADRPRRREEGYKRRGREDDRERRPDREERRREGEDGDVPRARGSFARTCSDIQQNGPFLEAICRDRRGEGVRSRIDLRSCTNVGNRDGRPKGRRPTMMDASRFSGTLP